MTDPIPQDAPDATADRTTLLAWYRDVVQTYIATHCYNDFVGLCHWCLSEEQQVRARNAGRYEPVRYCTKRCADSAEAYYAKVLRGDRTPVPSGEGEGEGEGGSQE